MVKRLFISACFAVACAASQATIVASSWTFYESPVPPANSFLAHRYEALPLRFAVTGLGIESQFDGWLWADGPYAYIGRGFRRVQVKFDGVVIHSADLFEPIGKPLLQNMLFSHLITESSRFPTYYQTHTVEFSLEFYGGSSGAIQYWKHSGVFYSVP